MKILQVNKLYAPTIGGIETIARQIGEGLNDKVNMAILVCREKGEAIEEYYNGVRVIRAKSHGIIMSLPISFDFFFKFHKLSKQADIIQIHEPFPLVDLALLLFRPKAKIVVWWHSDIVRQRFFRIIIAPIIKHTLKRADIIITATRESFKSIHLSPSKNRRPQVLSGYASKCIEIPFGLNFDEYSIPAITDFLTSRLNNNEKKKLLFVGRLVYYKGIWVLLEAMKTVNNAELFIVGNGVLWDGCIDYISANALTDKVHMLGSLPREELLAAFYDCDIFIFPSIARSEVFGLVQLEAMRYGKPVINTNLPTGVPHVSIDGETGVTVEAGSVDELSDAINLLVKDSRLREMYGRNAAQRVHERFDERVMLDNLYKVYEGLMGWV